MYWGEQNCDCMFLEICSLTPWHIQMFTFPDIQIISIMSEQLPELWRAVPSGQFPHPEEQPRMTSAWQNYSPEGKGQQNLRHKAPH